MRFFGQSLKKEGRLECCAQSDQNDDQGRKNPNFQTKPGTKTRVPQTVALRVHLSAAFV
jgi:hypothetical protein